MTGSGLGNVDPDFKRNKEMGGSVEFTRVRKIPFPLGFSGEGLGLEKDFFSPLFNVVASSYLIQPYGFEGLSQKGLRKDLEGQCSNAKGKLPWSS